MSSWDLDLEQRLRAAYGLKPWTPETGQTAVTTIESGDGFVTEAAGKLMLTAPGTLFSSIDELPAEVAADWQGKIKSNPKFAWVQGRYVGGEEPNRNGAFWSAGDLEVGVSTVTHGPFNWLHNSSKIIGAVVDSQLVVPPVSLQSATAARNPYIAALSVAWKWVNPDEVAVLHMASELGQLYYSMECIAEKIECLQSAGGCGEQFDYMKAMVAPGSTCEHIQSKSAARRLVNPTFLGGAAVVPPARPGWGEANASVMSQATVMAENTPKRNAALSDTQWETLMASVLVAAAAS